MTRREEQGAAALLTTLLVTVMLTMTVVLTITTAHIMRGADVARVAADAAALAVLSGSPLAGGTGPPDLEKGREVAVANGAELVAVDRAGWPLRVTVTVEVGVSGLPSGVNPTLRARAAARLEPPDDRTAPG